MGLRGWGLGLGFGVWGLEDVVLRGVVHAHTYYKLTHKFLMMLFLVTTCLVLFADLQSILIALTLSFHLPNKDL